MENMQEMNNATVILPTTGSPELKHAIESVLNQTYHTQLYLVVDGTEHVDKVRNIIDRNKLSDHDIKLCVLPQNVGANGFYGHRIYAAFTHLINTDYVLYLDQDCWFDVNHVEECIKTIETTGADWTHTLRNICDVNGNFICQDNCESLGPKWPEAGYIHVDTNCYCIKTQIATKLASAWHGGWGQDRIFLQTLHHHFQKVSSTYQYTVNYRLGGNEGSVKSDFFKNNNDRVTRKYNGALPWLI